MRSSNAPASAWPQVAPATLTERRNMKKAAQPEHSYTGYIPKWIQEKEDPTLQEAPQRTRNAPILGYSGHLRHEEDRIGTTFSKGLEISRQPEPARAGPLTGDNTSSTRRPGPNNQCTAESSSKKRVTFQEPMGDRSKTTGARATMDTTHEAMSRSSGYRDFEAESDAGDCQGRPHGMKAGSGYGDFDGASGYGDFAPPPPTKTQGGKPVISPRSAYGAFDQASGYGEFLAPPGISPRSGYGAFDGMSGYGQFLAPPKGARGGDFMSPRSAYGAFDQASGYGQFMAPPGNDNGISPRSAYGEFENASGYGAFQARPEVDDEEASPRSQDSQGYGAFGGGGSGVYGDFMSPRSRYGAFDNASGYGEFMAAPSSSASSSAGRGRPAARPVEQSSRLQTNGSMPPRQIIVKLNDELDRKYQRALKAVGGAGSVARLLDAFAATITQRHIKRTELLQTIKRNFEKHERENQGNMTKAHLKDALLGLSCVFTDDQIMALMSVYDPECRGTVSMDAILTDLTKRIMA